MTDVKFEGQSIPPRTMADSGQDIVRGNRSPVRSNKSSPEPYLNEDGSMKESSQPSPQSHRLKIKLSSLLDQLEGQEGRSERSQDRDLHGGNARENGHNYSFRMDERPRCRCRCEQHDFYYQDDDTSSQDSMSDDADSQSPNSGIIDNEIDELFKGITIGSSTSSVSKSLSSSSSDDDFNNAKLPDDFLEFEDFLALHSDWDSGLSSNNNSRDDDEWSVALSILAGNLPEFEAIRTLRQRRENEEVMPSYPHRALMYHECQVCLTRNLLRRRVCCDFHICSECMTTYVSMKVNEAKVQIECPNDRCNVLIHRDEVNERLPKDMKDKFARFLVNANTDPYKKTCPACSEIYTIEPKMLAVKKKKLKNGLKVQCNQCGLNWCYLCQASFHTEMTCKQFRKGDKMVKKWAKEMSAGQSNAQKCPKCHIFIQKMNGCDHMKCSKCNTDFCYRCGDRYISIKLLGNHWSKFSLFGCKYRLLPKRPALRRFIRGTNFAARVLAGVVLAGLGLAAGAVLVGASVVIVPGYGIFRLRRHLQMKEKLKRNRNRNRPNIERFMERDLHGVIMRDVTRLSTIAETEDLDAQQVQVMVHRSVSFTQEDVDPVQSSESENYEFYINRYTAEGTDVVISGLNKNDSDEVFVLSEVTEIENPEGYPTVVAHVVSKTTADKEVFTKRKASDKMIKESDGHQAVEADGAEVDTGKIDCQDKIYCGDAISNKNNKVVSEVSLRKNIIPTVDVPSCSEKSVSANSRVDSGYGDEESETGIHDTNSDGKTGNVIYGDEADSAKRGNNGCFGNIFSRRVPATQGNSDFPTIVKTQMSLSHKKSLSDKAATWEKCRYDRMQALIKSSPLDPVKDYNNLNLIMQKSSVDGKDIFNSDMRSLKISGEELSKSFIPAVDVSWQSGDTEGDSEYSLQDKGILMQHSRSSTSANNFHAAECYVSPKNEVTHL